MTHAAATADALLPTPLTIRKRRQENDDVFTWELDVSPLGGRFEFLPGQFNMLYLFGAGEVPISISGHPGRPDRLIHTIRSVGRVTRVMEGLRVGAQLGVRGPFGAPWPVEKAKGKDLLLVAGGIGLAPLRPVVYQMLEHSHEYRRLILLVGARSPEDLLYPQEALAWGTLHNVEVRVIVDRAGDEWLGEIGVVTQLLDGVALDPDRTVAMLCGPEIMMRFAARAVISRGLSPESVFVSMERNMHCAVGSCGHCQLGPDFICKDGPVLPWPRVEPLMAVREL